MSHIVADWVVRDAAAAVLRREGHAKEAEVLVCFGPSRFSTWLVAALAVKHPCFRSLAYAVALASKVDTDEACARVAERLVRDMAARSGLVWASGGSA